MPRGLLVPSADAAAVSTPRGDLTLHHERIAGVELHPASPAEVERNDVDGGAADAVYLSLDAMTFFHDAFARAYARSSDGGTFDLFVPRIVDGPALATELRAFLARVPADQPGRDLLAQTGAALIQLAEVRGRLWVLMA